MTEPKPKRKATDYAGLAALVTALATAAGIFWRQGQAEDTTAMVQDSAHAVVEFRLGSAEKEAADLRKRLRLIELKVAEAHGGPPPPAPRIGVTEAAGGVGGPTAVVMEVDSGGDEQTAEEAKEELVKKVRKKAPVRVQDIRQYVEKSNRPLKLEDF